METMKVETMGIEIIKPTTTTPNDHRTIQLSILDQLMPPAHVVAFLFYTKDDSISQEHTSNKLKTSLSETLTRFYPFAGRINSVTVDCNDKGAVFVDAHVSDCPLSHFLSSPDSESLQQLLPLDADVTPTWPSLLLVKATYFQCGGLAIAICLSHKLADAASLSTFIRAWAATARGESDSVASPEFATTKLYPPAKVNKASKVNKAGKRTSVTKRFVFVASKLEELRKKAASADTVPRPTRVQSVTSLIWRRVVAASPTREKVLVQPANLRPKIPSLFSENLIGNLMFSTTTLNGKGEVQISETVKELQKRAEELASLIQELEKSPSTNDSKLVSEMMDRFCKLGFENHESYIMSSWCKMQFYEASFGWGTPVWVAGNVFPTIDNVTILMDSNDGEGIEAWVTLYQEDMSLFEQNPDLLAFASPNLNVLV